MNPEVYDKKINDFRQQHILFCLCFWVYFRKQVLGLHQKNSQKQCFVLYCQYNVNQNLSGCWRKYDCLKGSYCSHYLMQISVWSSHLFRMLSTAPLTFRSHKKPNYLHYLVLQPKNFSVSRHLAGQQALIGLPSPNHCYISTVRGSRLRFLLPTLHFLHLQQILFGTKSNKHNLVLNRIKPTKSQTKCGRKCECALCKCDGLTTGSEDSS